MSDGIDRGDRSASRRTPMRFADFPDDAIDVASIDAEELAKQLLFGELTGDCAKLTIEQTIGILAGGILIERDCNERQRQKIDVNTLVEYPDKIQIALATTPKEARLLVSKFDEQTEVSQIIEIVLDTEDVANVGNALQAAPWRFIE